MLVLSRKLNEKIVIGDSVVITIVDVGNGRVRVGIEAPRNVPVNRLEVLQALAAQNSFASDESPAVRSEPAATRPAPIRLANRRALVDSSL